jgi:hypothetical protein
MSKSNNTETFQSLVKRSGLKLYVIAKVIRRSYPTVRAYHCGVRSVPPDVLTSLRTSIKYL